MEDLERLIRGVHSGKGMFVGKRPKEEEATKEENMKQGE